MADIENNLTDSIEEASKEFATKQTENLLQTLGRWANTALSNSEFIMEWRIKNIIDTSKKFEKICEKNNITQNVRDELSIKFGVNWIKGASDEDNSTIQDLWAGVLAREMLNKNSISIRTLNFIKSISEDEKILFDTVRPFVVSSNHILLPCDGEDLINQNNFAFSYLNYLELMQLGLISQQSILFTDKEGIVEIEFANKQYRLKSPDKKKRFGIQVIPLLKIGKEIFNSLDPMPNLEYLKKCVNSYKKENWDIEELSK